MPLTTWCFGKSEKASKPEQTQSAVEDCEMQLKAEDEVLSSTFDYLSISSIEIVNLLSFSFKIKSELQLHLVHFWSFWISLYIYCHFQGVRRFGQCDWNSVFSAW